MNGLVAASITLRSPAASKGRRQSTRGPGKARAFSTSVRTLKDDVFPMTSKFTHIGTSWIWNTTASTTWTQLAPSGTRFPEEQVTQYALGSAIGIESINLQAWLALDPQRFRALLPASWDDLALVSGWVLIF